ncbi:hypothetical protein BGW38_002203, partial [Lunasporangiospora selenospora]
MAAKTDLHFEEISTSVQVKIGSKPLETSAIPNANLFVISNTYGYFIAGSSDGFVFDKLEKLRKTFVNGSPDGTEFAVKNRVNIPGDGVRTIRLSSDELTVVVALDGGEVQLYSIASLLANPKGAKSDASFSLGKEIVDILPNPGHFPQLAAILFEDNTISLMDMNGKTVAKLDKHQYTAMTWSSKGKQLMCGTNTGHLYQIDEKGAIKKEHLPNKGFEGNYVVSIDWVETSVIVVVYSTPPENGEKTFGYNICVIAKDNKTEHKYINLGDSCFPDNQEDAGDACFVTPSIKSWGPNLTEMITFLCSSSTDVLAFGRGSNGQWEKWDLADTSRPMVPLDTHCVGTALDLTSTDKLPPREEDGKDVEPVPILYIYNHTGTLSAYRVLNMKTVMDGVPCPDMVRTKELPLAGANAPPAASQPTIKSVTKATPVPVTFPPPSAPPPLASSRTPIKASQPMPAPVSAPEPGFHSMRKPSQPMISSPLKPASSSKLPGPQALFDSSSAATRSIAPNPVFTPNANLQQHARVDQTSFAAPKPPGMMQRLLNEAEEPLRINHRQSVTEEPSAPTVKVSVAMDALSRQLENTYLAMTQELVTLRSHVRETEELVKAREHVFGEIDQFLSLTVKRIKKAAEIKGLVGTVLDDFLQLRTDLIKVTTKKEEVGRLLKARQDPSLLELVMMSGLNPAQISQQDQMKKSFEAVDSQLQQVEEFIDALHQKATKLRHGHTAEAPTLDSIRRSIRNISSTLIQRQNDLDELSSQLDRLSVSSSLNLTTSQREIAGEGLET